MDAHKNPRCHQHTHAVRPHNDAPRVPLRPDARSVSARIARRSDHPEVHVTISLALDTKLAGGSGGVLPTHRSKPGATRHSRTLPLPWKRPNLDRRGFRIGESHGFRFRPPARHPKVSRAEGGAGKT